MKKLLIISENQFGYLMDNYYACKYLKDDIKITVLCQDTGNFKRNMDNVEVYYRKIKGNFLIKHLKFIIDCYKFYKKNSYDIVFIDKFRFSFLFSFLIENKKLILDIRTVSINKNKIKQWLNDLELKLNTKFFKNISVIDEKVALNLKIKKYFLLPLGSEKLVERTNEREDFNLFYIGTLKLRNIEKTIEGFYYFLKKCNAKSNYYIVGDGNNKEIDILLETINKYNIKERVFFLGRKEHSEIKELLLKSKVGVSFIPKTTYFENQPPTKTYEYLVNGLICIGTNTEANKKIINGSNGVLCDDNAVDFSKKLEYLYVNLKNYNQKKIQETSEKYLWKNIIDTYFKNMIKSILK